MLAGLVAIVPLLVTWVVVDFVFGVLERAGRPLARWLAGVFETREGLIAAWLLQPWLQWVLAVGFTILGLYLLGFAASKVVGSRVIAAAENLLGRVPFIKAVYHSTKKLVDVMRTKPDERPVVLIEFPNDKMKVLGFVTRIVTDQVNGGKLAVVYVPTTPNPTSGYLEIVPLERIVYTDLTFEQGMSFIVTGGAIGPDSIRYSSTPSTSDGADQRDNPQD